MSALESKLRRGLEKSIIEARKEAVKGAEEALRGLGVHEGKRGTMSEADAALRNKLRAHARQIGDRRNSQTGAQAIDRLVQEWAYAHWHRMLFARFLGDNADNPFLIEPESGVSVSLDDVKDLAAELCRDRWELAAEFAARTLPAIFHRDDPLLQVKFSREKRLKLEKILEDIPSNVFAADDSLGWVYQFWQSEEKEKVNQGGDKITGQTLPAVTQLFTEHYMVLFLLHNTLGAWRAAKVLATNPSLAENAKDEDELRRAVALTEVGGYSFDYLRFVREPGNTVSPRTASGRGAGGEGQSEGDLGPWRPMGGTYSGWPKTASALKVLDPSCGSGHFLVAVFELLVRLRMHEEGLEVYQAVEAVLSNNLFGMEIDPRCTQIAAFNLALAAWKFTGPKPLPPMRNIACSGIPLGNSRDDWMKLLRVEEASSLLPLSTAQKKRLEAASTMGFQWGQLYDMFSKADTLGSLINPQRFFGSGMLQDEQLDQISEALLIAVASDTNATDEQHELAAAAQGLTRATELLSGRYTLVITNVPYLGRGKQDEDLKKYLDTQYALGKADLASAFVLRSLELCTQGGSTALVTPQNWLFLTTYKKLRETLLERRQWDFVARLGTGAFETIGGHVVNVVLLGVTADQADNNRQMAGIDVSAAKEPEEKAAQLCGQEPTDIVLIPQEQQLDNPDAKFSMSRAGRSALLSEFAGAPRGVVTGDNEFWVKQLWELPQVAGDWRYLQTSIDDSLLYTGRSKAIYWRTIGAGMLRPGLANTSYGKRGVAVAQIGDLPCTIYSGELYDNASFAVVPLDESLLPALAAFCFDPAYHDAVRHFNQKLSVDPSHLINIPFDLKHWQTVAAEKYPNGLPEPESDDPTQWLFHGRLEQSTRNEAITSLLAKIPIRLNLAGFQSPRDFMMDRRGEGVNVIIERSRAISGKRPQHELLGDSELMLTIFAAEPPIAETLL